MKNANFFKGEQNGQMTRVQYDACKASCMVVNRWLYVFKPKKQEHNSCRLFKLEMEWNEFDLLRQCTSRFSFLRYFRHHNLILYQHYFRSFLIIWLFKKRKELIPWETNSYKQLLFKEKVKKKSEQIFKKLEISRMFEVYCDSFCLLGDLEFAEKRLFV